MDEDSGAVRVVCRFRPQNKREIESGAGTCVQFPQPTPEAVRAAKKKGQKLIQNTVSLAPYTPDRTFVYDAAFDIDCTQDAVYDAAARPIVDCVLKGFNGCVMAYGQTGSGKTHTMQGYWDFEKDVDMDGLQDVVTEDMGVIPRMIHTVFTHVSNADEHIEFQLKVSIFEIYMEKIKDLLDTNGTRDNLKIREDTVRGIYVEDLTEWYVGSVEEVFQCFKFGHANRSVAATQMNATSSRSHLLFQVVITQRNTFDLSQKVGKLYLVDLAGSEKLSKTGASGTTAEEGKLINKSLSALGNVINALTAKAGVHIPYRDSKLTRVLQDNLGGNSQTCLVIAASPSSFNDAETLSTMRFGQRAKQVKNKPVVNEERSVEELERLLGIANATIDEHEEYIDTLEKFIQGLGKELPPKPAKGAKKKEEAAAGEKGGEDAEGGESDDGDDREDELHDKNVKLKVQSEQITELQAECARLAERVDELENHEESTAGNAVQQEAQADRLAEEITKVQKLESEKKALEEQIKILHARGPKAEADQQAEDGEEPPTLPQLPPGMSEDADKETAAPSVDTALLEKIKSESAGNPTLQKVIDQLEQRSADLGEHLEQEKKKSQKLRELFKVGCASRRL
eukprot:GHVU01081842.1.p1 GENE.GHVU01081842.1~~GHVU01081842.1.p1  ORF type:complete len:625 (+),score=148.66 GHVU01081842.1:1602-3476(+)